MAAAAHPWRADKAGLRLLARVTPKSSVDAVEGVMETAEGLALKVRVRAVAQDGEANAAVERVVARWLDLPRTRVAVAQGHKSRVKTLAVGGAPAELEALVAARVAALR
jgi:uncharacterized protein YggU (UPF0235/DUF167 family)